MSCAGCQLLDLHRPSRPLQAGVNRAPPRGETRQGVEATAESGGGLMRREIRRFSAPRAACRGGTPARPDF